MYLAPYSAANTPEVFLMQRLNKTHPHHSIHLKALWRSLLLSLTGHLCAELDVEGND